jgi:hypothetical protein
MFGASYIVAHKFYPGLDSSAMIFSWLCSVLCRHVFYLWSYFLDIIGHLIYIDVSVYCTCLPDNLDTFGFLIGCYLPVYMKDWCSIWTCALLCDYMRHNSTWSSYFHYLMAYITKFDCHDVCPHVGGPNFDMKRIVKVQMKLLGHKKFLAVSTKTCLLRLDSVWSCDSLICLWWSYTVIESSLKVKSMYIIIGWTRYSVVLLLFVLWSHCLTVN